MRRLWHYSCSHGSVGILRDREVRPNPATGLAWFTDLPAPDREALGLTSYILAYAMSFGGRMDRRWLRVSPIGGVSAAHKSRADWERHYYGDMVRAPQANTDREKSHD